MTAPAETRRRSDWPEARVATMRSLFDEGLSHELIARKMGVSKGTVSAKIDRLGWVRSATIVALRPDRTATIALAEARRARLSAERQAEEVTIGFTLLELPDWACRWPLGLSMGQRTFCGCPRGEGLKSYCQTHERRSRAGTVKSSSPLRSTP